MAFLELDHSGNFLKSKVDIFIDGGFDDLPLVYVNF